ncbi:Fur family transcriptional regulator [Anaeropeptidivorans aminofermentans]|uniref:Fur family transcriptional regulator n=1 Tax=Anaeropeptidivorans aminofermentans TaxID=2934315 RepID=UPI002024209A|nr:transcriptional repressor [Anaeropeptidivorans aminofermentans]
MKQSETYQTKNRKRIWEFISSQKGIHFTANDMYRYFIIHGSTISMPTIYRQLDKMTEAGLLHKYRTAESDTAFYYSREADGDSRELSHMKCTNCGKMFPLKCNVVEQMAEHVWNRHSFYIKLENTLLYSKCAQCRVPQQKE